MESDQAAAEEFGRYNWTMFHPVLVAEATFSVATVLTSMSVLETLIIFEFAGPFQVGRFSKRWALEVHHHNPSATEQATTRFLHARRSLSSRFMSSRFKRVSKPEGYTSIQMMNVYECNGNNIFMRLRFPALNGTFSSITEWKYSFHCTNKKHSLFVLYNA